MLQKKKLKFQEESWLELRTLTRSIIIIAKIRRYNYKKLTFNFNNYFNL